MSDVAARVVLDLLDFLGRKGINRKQFLDHVRARGLDAGAAVDDLSDAALTAKRHRVAWNSFALLLDLWSEAIGGSAVEREFAVVSYTIKRGRWTKVLPYIGGLVTSPMQLYKLTARAAALNFPNARVEQGPTNDGRYAVDVSLRPEDQGSLAFFRLNSDLFACLPRMIGCDEAIVESEITARTGRYIVTLPPSRSLAARSGRYMRALLDVRSLLRQLDEREEQILESYNTLLDSHKMLEQRVRDRTQALEAALDAMKEVQRIAHLGSFDLDLRTNIVVMSDESRRIFDLPERLGQVSADDLFIRIPDPTQSRVQSAIKRCVDLGEAIDLEHDIQTNDGGARQLHLRGALCRDPVGRPERILGTVQDITLRKLYERSIVEARDAADTANRLKSTFLANISHEIRTPMTIVLGYADMVGDERLARDLRAEYAGRMQRNGRHLLALIDDLLALSCVETGRLTLRRVVFAPAVEIAQVTESLRIVAEAKGIGLRLTTGELEPALMRSDPVRLRQIVMNVVSNAIKFTDVGWVTVATSVKSVPSGPLLEIKIQDTGIGIPHETHQLLFQPFSQAHLLKSHQRGGSGLGLALARELARSMGGDVVLAGSILNSGSTFIVTVLMELGSEALTESQ